MSNKLADKILEWGIYLWVFLLPWQTRLIIKQGYVRLNLSEYGTISLYGLDILLIILVILKLIAGYKNKKSFNTGMWPFVIALLAIAFVSVYWAFDSVSALFGFVKMAEGIIIFWLISSSIYSLVKVNVAFCLAAVIQAAIGIIQFLTQKSFFSKWLGMALHDPAVSGTSVIESAGARFLRAYGSLPHPNILAGYLVLAIILFVGLYFSTRKRLWRSLSLAGFVIATAGMILTFSRSIWVVLCLSLFFVLLTAYFTKGKIVWFYKILGFVGIIIAVTAVFGLLFPQIIQTRIAGETRLEKLSLEQRIGYYNQAWELIKSDSLTGAGINNYAPAANALSPNNEDIQPVHNVYVLVLAELGVFGLVIYLLMVSQIFLQSAQTLKNNFSGDNPLPLVYVAVMAAIFVLFLFDHYFWTLNFGIMLFWFCLGLWHKSIIEKE